MEFNGFTQEDFDVFKINGLEERMEAIKKHIRPKFERLGELFSPTLTVLTGDEMFPHIAKHARRTVNPPNDTWIAFANNARGYKKHPHFQIGLWETHLFVWFAMIYESPIKADYARVVSKHVGDILSKIPDTFVWSTDHTKAEATVQSSLTKEDLDHMVKRLQDVKKSELLCGIHIPRDDKLLQNGSELIQYIEDAFHHLSYLYSFSKQLTTP